MSVCLDTCFTSLRMLRLIFTVFPVLMSIKFEICLDFGNDNNQPQKNLINKPVLTIIGVDTTDICVKM